MPGEILPLFDSASFLCRSGGLPEIRLGPAVAALPVKNEADEIGPCLAAMAAQHGAALDGIVLCLNDCSDDTAARIAACTPSLPFPVHCLTVTLPRDRACAGMARRIAMDHAAALAGADGIVLTSDADGRVAPYWLAANLAALRAGADAVAGQADIDPEGAALIPAHLHAIDARECAYAALLDEIRSILDPDPADPWPRHDEHSGASIAVTVEAYRRAGGMPPVPLGEDRAFFAALRRVDARIRHDRDARVVVSARIVGRAQGGMADTIRRRMQCVDPHIDDRLERVDAAVRRARLRARLHRAWQGDDALNERLCRILQVSPTVMRLWLNAPYFGEAWEQAELVSPVLSRDQVPLADLAAQTARGLRARDLLRGALMPAEDPGGIALREAAE
jgi:hypothetical protein